MKHIGHSLASLYRNTSIGWPLTKGSGGSLNSRGDISLSLVVREADPKLAKVFARDRKGSPDVLEGGDEVEGVR